MKHLEIETYCCFKQLIVIFLASLSLSLSAQSLPETGFLSLDPEEVTGRSFSYVTAIAKSPSDGSVWIGTEGDGVLRIGRNGKRIRYSSEDNGLLSDEIREMCFVSPSRLYILYKDGSLSAYSPTEGFSHRRVIDGKIDHILPGTEEGQLLLAAETGEIHVFDESSGVRSVCDFHEPLSAVRIRKDGAVYGAGRSSRSVQVFAVDGSVGKTGPVPESPNCMVVLDDAQLWVGTDQGLYQWKENAWKRYSTEDGMGSNHVKSIVSDGKDQIYIATSRGIEGINVSNSDVSKSNLFFPGESFLSGVRTEGPDLVYYFGGVRGVAAISADTPSEVLSWAAPAREDNPVKRTGFSFWRILLLVGICLVGLLAGWLFLPKMKRKAVRAIPAAKVPDASGIVKDVMDSSPTVVPPTREEVFEVVDKLKRADAPEFSLKVWNMIEESYTDQEFSVASVASRLLLTRVHVNRKLQAELGVSPSALIKARRMSAAMELMQCGGLTLPQIAEQTGFSSASYLSSSFKEYYGVSPSEVMHAS